MAFRVGFSIILLLSVLFLPFWVSVVLALAGMLAFPFFLEAVFLLFLSDLLYGAKEARFFSAVFISLITAVLFFIAVEFFKKKTRVLY